MKKRSLLALFLAMMLLLAGCGDKSGSEEGQGSDSSGNTENSGENSGNSGTVVSEEDMFTNRDMNADYDENKSVVVTLDGTSASCESDAVKINGTTITISEEATYIFRGTLEDGMIVVDADEKDKPQIVLDGASITSSTSAALYILEADKVVVTLADGTENTLANGGSFEAIDDNNIDGAVFSKQDLTFNGSGSLTVTSPADHGIVCKDDLVFTGGVYTVASASHALDANDSVRMTNATMEITAGKDGIHAENSDDTSLGFVYVADGSYNISAEGDGMSAGAYLWAKDGTYDIVSGGGSENAANQTSDSWGDFMGGPGMGGHGMGGPGMGGYGGSRMNSGREGNSSDSYSATEMSYQSSSSYGATEMSSQTSDSFGSNVTSGATEDSSTSIKGMKATGDIMIDGGTFTIDSADDSVHSNASITVNGGTFHIASGDDAFHADDTLTITDGTIDITESYEGLEGLHIKVSGGDIKLVSSDDGLNAAGGTDSSGTGGVRGGDQFGGRGGMGGGMSSSSNGSIVISGGDLYVNASGDGIDANGYLEITGGYTVVVGPTQGDTATLDYDTSATITGGTFIGTGASGMAQTFSDSEQGVIAVSVGNCTAGTEISLQDADGNTVLSYAPELNFAVVILSSPDIEKGETYKIIVGDASGEFEAS